MTSAPHLRTEHHWTVEEYMALDDDQRYELLKGDLLVTPAPTEPHQYFITQFGAEITVHVREHGLGRTYDAPFDVVLSDDTVLQPDLTFVAADRVDEALDHQGAIAAPDLVVEVMSPSTESRDRVLKRRIYADHGVTWLVFADPDSRVVELFRLDDTGHYLLRESFAAEETFSCDLFPSLTIDLSDMWAPAD
jgi:Uma2 family endonuclease